MEEQGNVPNEEKVASEEQPEGDMPEGPPEDYEQPQQQTSKQEYPQQQYPQQQYPQQQYPQQQYPQQQYPQQQYPQQQYPQQQYPQQQYGAPPASPKPSPYSGLDPLFTKPMIVLAVCVGALLAWIGKLIVIFTDSTDHLEIGNFIISTGGIIIFGGAFLGAVANKEFDRYTRLGLLILAGIGLYIASMSLVFNIGSLY